MCYLEICTQFYCIWYPLFQANVSRTSWRLKRRINSIISMGQQRRTYVIRYWVWNIHQLLYKMDQWWSRSPKGNNSFPFWGSTFFYIHFWASTFFSHIFGWILQNLEPNHLPIPYAAIGFFLTKQLKLVEMEDNDSYRCETPKCIPSSRTNPISLENNTFYFFVEILSIGASFLNCSTPTMVRRLARFTFVSLLILRIPTFAWESTFVWFCFSIAVIREIGGLADVFFTSSDILDSHPTSYMVSFA